MRPQPIESLERPTFLQEAAPQAALGDLRFRNLLSSEDWNTLPPAVRKRFTKRLSGTAAAIYVGEVVETKFTRIGWLIAQAARIAGAPLPTSRMDNTPSIVTVTEDGAGGGQVWTRLYGRANTFPQVIHSAKRFGGPTGLEEYAAAWIGMALTVHVEDRALVFRSERYFLKFGRLRVALPLWFTPGAITVTHTEIDEGRFTFTLKADHPLFGEIIYQRADFHDAN